MLSVPMNLGYGALFGLILAESAGIPVPGETALLAAGALAGAGKLSLPLVIVIAAVASIIGDNLGYWAGRRGGRRVLAANGPLAAHRRTVLRRGEEFFQRHGAKTVFLARWVTGVRLVAAVLAGASEMRWRTFVVFNVLGALAWASITASVAALIGPIGIAIVYGGGLAIGAFALLRGAYHARKARPTSPDACPPPPSPITHPPRSSAYTAGTPPSTRASPSQRSSSAARRST